MNIDNEDSKINKNWMWYEAINRLSIDGIKPASQAMKLCETFKKLRKYDA